MSMMQVRSINPIEARYFSLGLMVPLLTFVLSAAVADPATSGVAIPAVLLVIAFWAIVVHLGLMPLIESGPHRVATFDKPDARSRVEEHLIPIRFPTNRIVKNALLNGVIALRTIRAFRPDVIVSAGTAPAVSSFWVTKVVSRAVTVYIEPVDGLRMPTLTARLVWRARMSPLCNMIRSWWAGRGATRSGLRYESLRCRWDARAGLPAPLANARSGSRRLPFLDVTAQWGCGSKPWPDVRGETLMAHNRLVRSIQGATIVVSQASPGLARSILSEGRPWIAVPRLSSLGERVDDHQVDLAHYMQSKGVATLAMDAEDLLRGIVAISEEPRVERREWGISVAEEAFAADVFQLIEDAIASRTHR